MWPGISPSGYQQVGADRDCKYQVEPGVVLSFLSLVLLTQEVLFEEVVMLEEFYKALQK